jgi:hypothetical protein
MAAILTIAGVLAVGSAAVTNCYGGGSVGPAPTTTTTTAPPPLSVGVFPEVAGPDTMMRADGTGCVGTNPEVRFVVTPQADPATVIADGNAVPDASGNWQEYFSLPPVGITNGTWYSMTATCYDPYPTVVFVYPSRTFLGGPEGCPPNC